MNVGRLMNEGVETATTAGMLLREARQACGVHIAALAVSLKVPVSKLEALESDNYEALPDTVFVRALASSVCRTLKIDAGPILSLLPRNEPPKLLSNSAGLNTAVKGSFGKGATSTVSSFSTPNSASRPLAWVVLILLVGALLLYFYPRHREQDLRSVATAPSPLPADSASGVSRDGASRAPAVVDRPSTVPVVVSAGVANVASSALPESSVAVSGVIPVSPASAENGRAPASLTPPATLLLRARSESWVQVRDGQGAVALQRNLVAGESVALGSPLPLTVVIGRADATEVTVKGKPFDLVPVTRENVARFEVK